MKHLSLILFTLSTFSISAKVHKIHAYKSYSTSGMQKMLLMGQITTKTKITNNARRRILEYDTREMMITARLYDHEAIRLGDHVYIIQKELDHKRYKNGYIIGEGEVYSIFQTEFQGWMLKAKGNFSMVKKGHFIAIPDAGDFRNEALVYFKKGDRERVLGNLARAFQYYKKSIETDSNRPETYVRLAQLSMSQGRSVEARQYIKGAWARLNKFQDANEVLRLPGLYLKWELDFVESKIKSKKKSLRRYLALLKDIRHYQRQLDWYKHSFRPAVLKMIVSKGLPKYEYQFQKGRLFEKIYLLLGREHGDNVLSRPNKEILMSLDKAERQTLYKPIKVPGIKKGYLHPKKQWSSAFMHASLYHYRLAHDELNPLDTRAALQIVRLCYFQYNDRAMPKPQKKDYAAWIDYYGRAFLRVPNTPSKMQIVRSYVRKVQMDGILKN